MNAGFQMAPNAAAMKVTGPWLQCRSALRQNGRHGAAVHVLSANELVVKIRHSDSRRNPQPTGGPDTIKMHVTPWVEDKHGILGREIYAIDE